MLLRQPQLCRRPPTAQRCRQQPARQCRRPPLRHTQCARWAPTRTTNSAALAAFFARSRTRTIRAQTRKSTRFRRRQPARLKPPRAAQVASLFCQGLRQPTTSARRVAETPAAQLRASTAFKPAACAAPAGAPRTAVAQRPLRPPPASSARSTATSPLSTTVPSTRRRAESTANARRARGTRT